MRALARCIEADPPDVSRARGLLDAHPDLLRANQRDSLDLLSFALSVVARRAGCSFPIEDELVERAYDREAGLIELLLQHDTPVDATEDLPASTPLSYAVRMIDVRFAMEFIRRGADPTRTLGSGESPVSILENFIWEVSEPQRSRSARLLKFIRERDGLRIAREGED